MTQQFNQSDANELASRRAAEQRLLDKYKGVKPLVVWYALVTIALVVGAFSSFSVKGGAVGGLICLALAALSALYVRYLYRGGLHRVWFFIF